MYVSEKNAILAWHFINQNGYLAHDMHDVKAEKGHTYVWPSPRDGISWGAVDKTGRRRFYPALCTRGLHGSIRVEDALSYATTEDWIVCRVKIWGEVRRGGDKLVGTRRNILWMAHCWPIMDKMRREFPYCRFVYPNDLAHCPTPLEEEFLKLEPKEA